MFCVAGFSSPPFIGGYAQVLLAPAGPARGSGQVTGAGRRSKIGANGFWWRDPCHPETEACATRVAHSMSLPALGPDNHDALGEQMWHADT